MSPVSRRTFLGFLAGAAVAPAALGRAAAATPAPAPLVLWGCTTKAQAMRAALWARQCGRNPARMWYHLVAQHYGPEHIDIESVRQAAAYCDQPLS